MYLQNTKKDFKFRNQIPGKLHTKVSVFNDRELPLPTQRDDGINLFSLKSGGRKCVGLCR